MDIGTAKPEPELLEHAPHRLVDIREPSEPYSAADFRQDALEAIAEITDLYENCQNVLEIHPGFLRSSGNGIGLLPVFDHGIGFCLKFQ